MRWKRSPVRRTCCSESFIRSYSPVVQDVVLSMVSLDYDDTIMAAAGEQAEESLHETMEKYKGNYILAVEGNVPLNEGGINCIPNGEIFLNKLKTVAAGAKAVIGWGSCAAWGCVQAAKPNPTKSVPITEIITDKTKIVAVTHVSNVIGRVNPIREIADMAHRVGAVIVVDGAQSTPHIPVDVQALDADFLAFSGHKVFGPMGIGALYGKRRLLEKMPPFLSGGEMIESVTRTGATYAELPYKFEAGTGNAAGAVGLHAAIRYMQSVGFDTMHERETALVARMMAGMADMPFIHVLGSAIPEEHSGIVTFTVDGVHPHDVSEILAADGVCIRAGHHCAQPLLKHLGYSSTVRASCAFYNTPDEVNRLLDSLKTIRERMGYGKQELL